MPEFRRYFVAGGTYFFTLVTACRAPLFRCPPARRLLGDIIRQERQKALFTTVALVLMPDHLHTIWTLPIGDEDYPNRWRAIKARFTSEWLRIGGQEHEIAAGYGHQRRRGIWQPRYMEHTIRDEEHLHNHADYLHYNPVKHGYVRRPADWPWSSFHRYVSSGDYPAGWGADAERPPDFDGIDEGLIE